MTGFCLRGGKRRSVVVVVLVVVVRLGLAGAAWTLAGCRASVPGAASAVAGPGAAPGGTTVSRHADSAPITALVVAAPYVWAGTEHGLRRWKAAAKGDV